MVPRCLLRLFGLTPSRERSLARAAVERELTERHRPEAERAIALRTSMGARQLGPHVTLGQLDDGSPYALPLEDFDGLFGWVSGATGSGKTRLALAWLDQLLRLMAGGEAISIVVLDLKGELTELVLALTARILDEVPSAEPLLQHLLTIRFFRGEFLPGWNLLAPMPGLSPATQARAIAEALEHALGMGLGSRQENVLGMVLSVGIELGLTIPELRAALWTPETLQAQAARSRSPEVRLYFRHRFARESPATVDGLATRLDILLSHESVRAMVSARSALDWRERLGAGRLSVLDLGGAPFGADGPRRAMASLSLQFVLSGVFDPGRRRDAFTLLVCDEVQEAVTPATLRNLDRIVSTARSFRTGLVSIHQSLSQLPAPFLHLLSTNVRVRAIGRSGVDDAALSREWLPVSGNVPRGPARIGERPEVLSRTDEERLHIAELGRLPRRRFLLADRVAPWGAQWITAPEIDVTEWMALPSALRARLERGAYGLGREELLGQSRLPDEGDDAASAVPSSARAPRKGRGRRAPEAPAEMPDLIEAAESWGRGRRVR